MQRDRLSTSTSSGGDHIPSSSAPVLTIFKDKLLDEMDLGYDPHPLLPRFLSLLEESFISP